MAKGYILNIVLHSFYSLSGARGRCPPAEGVVNLFTPIVILLYEIFKELSASRTSIQPFIHTTIPHRGEHSLFPTGFT
jgi:hypothetical protein